ncbi:hypothetical protein QYE76_065194 [Lolium multiflorum]|uniref:Uncharacterized protein n=1 Tax=Lolium multiflorum TaxID=4521 RepID=A0AAD8WAT2_LOLMU|nr:hypothetical protein QYE76_065194 [Lolium multiflorum]
MIMESGAAIAIWSFVELARACSIPDSNSGSPVMRNAATCRMYSSSRAWNPCWVETVAPKAAGGQGRNDGCCRGRRWLLLHAAKDPVTARRRRLPLLAHHNAGWTANTLGGDTSHSFETRKESVRDIEVDERGAVDDDDLEDVEMDAILMGTHRDATIAKSRQIENTETPNENAATPVNSPESVEYSSDDLDEDYVELDDDFIEKCNATTDARKIKKLLAEHAVRYKPSPDPKFATSPINIRDKDYDFSLDLSHIAIVEKTPFCGKELQDAEELLVKIGRNHDDWSTPEPTPTPIVKKRGMIKLNDEDMREAKKSLKEKGIKPEDVKNLPPIEDLCETIPPSSMIEYMKDIVTNKRKIPNEEISTMLANYSFNGKIPKKLGDPGAVIDCNKGMVTFNVDDKEHTVYFPKRIDKKGKMKKFKFGELFKKATTSTGRPSRASTQIRRSYNEDVIAPRFAPEEDHGAPNASSFPCYEFLTNAGILDDFFTLVNRAGLATYVGDERGQYYRLTKVFVESFKFHNTEYEPTVAFKIYDIPITMKLEEFCCALGIAPVGTARRIDDNPRDLLELYRGITGDDCRTIQRGKIRNIQLPAIKYFAYYIGGLFLEELLHILTHLDIPLDSNDVPLTPRKLDIAAMKSHRFVTTDSTIDNMVYRMLFADGNEKEIPLPQPGLFNIDRQSWSLTKEVVEEHMKIQEFHQQHDSENAEPSYDYTVTYPDVSSSTYMEPGRSSSYYETPLHGDRGNELHLGQKPKLGGGIPASLILCILWLLDTCTYLFSLLEWFSNERR